MTSIGESAICCCQNRTSEVLGTGVTTIGESVFSGCSSLSKLYITDISTWLLIDFGDGRSNPLLNGGCLYLNNEPLNGDVIIPEETTAILDYAFINYASITSITIPNSVTIIGTEAFSGCSNLVNIIIPDSVTSVGARVFSGCSSLLNIVFEDAFDWCTTPSSYDWNNKSNGTEIIVTDPSINALYFTTTYIHDYWYKN